MSSPPAPTNAPARRWTRMHLTGFYSAGMHGHYSTNDGEFYVIDSRATDAHGNRHYESEVARVWVKAPTEEGRKVAKERANLFAAAPQLFEALTELESWVTDDSGGDTLKQRQRGRLALIAARAALRAAEGGEG